MSDNRLYDSTNGTEAKPTTNPASINLVREADGNTEDQPIEPENLEAPTKPRGTNS